jgi:hypothetical protein
MRTLTANTAQLPGRLKFWQIALAPNPSRKAGRPQRVMSGVQGSLNAELRVPLDPEARSAPFCAFTSSSLSGAVGSSAFCEAVHTVVGGVGVMIARCEMGVCHVPSNANRTGLRGR